MRREKIDAKNAIYRALRSGVLVRPDKCEHCGKKCVPAGHHHNGYDEDHQLDVQWLCRQCHYTIHTKHELDKPEVRSVLSERAREHNRQMGFEKLSEMGRRGGAASAKALRKKYTKEQLSALKRKAAYAGNKARWGYEHGE